MKVRITAKPRVREVDGVSLDNLLPGTVRDITSSIASWLIAEHYAVPEMRRDISTDSGDTYSAVKGEMRRQSSISCPRRRADDR